MTLASFQQAIVASRAQHVAVLASRRCGKSYALANAAALRLVGFRIGAAGLERDPDGPTPQLLASHSELAAQHLLAAVHAHVEALARTGLLPRDRFPGDLSASSFTLGDGAGTSARALADNSRTARGGEGDLTVDEACFQRNFEEFYGAASLLAGATKRRPSGYRVRVASTPWVEGTLAHRILDGDGSALDSMRHFARWRITVQDACRAGVPRPMSEAEQHEYLDRLRAELGAESFDREMGLQWVSASSMFLSREMLEGARYAPNEFPAAHDIVRRVAGADIARSKTGNLNVILQVSIDRSGVLWAHPPEVARGQEFSVTQDAIGRCVTEGCARVAVDAGGLGAPLAEALSKAHPGKIESVVFSASRKTEMLEGLAAALQFGKLRLPADIGLLRDLASLRKVARAGGGYSFDAPTGADGSHADRAIALALAVSIANAGSDADGRVYSAGRREAVDVARAYLGDERSSYRGPAADWFPEQFGRGRGRPDRGPFG